ncbi:LamG domain-containing protein [Candidatus Poribacteria bacterium]|nr:LamG domain-containing protein [Candidatus Poribacteria bacterium]
MYKIQPHKTHALAVFALICLPASIIMNASAQVVTDGLVSYWTFDKADSEGNTLKDVWGKNDGIIVGNSKIVQGKFGDALQFDGIDDHVDCGNDPSLTSINELTLEAWINRKKGGIMMVAGISRHGAVTYGIGPTNSGYIASNLWNGSAIGWLEGRKPMTLNEWYHVVTVFDGSEERVYVDGELDGTRAFNGLLKYNEENFWISGGSGLRVDLLFGGIIDEVRVYNRGLSDAEINRNLVSSGVPTAVKPAEKLARLWGKIKVER